MSYIILQRMFPMKESISYMKERFGVELTSDQLNHLTKYDVFELHEFVTELKQIIRAYKK